MLSMANVTDEEFDSIMSGISKKNPNRVNAGKSIHEKSQRDEDGRFKIQPAVEQRREEVRVIQKRAQQVLVQNNETLAEYIRNIAETSLIKLQELASEAESSKEVNSVLLAAESASRLVGVRISTATKLDVNIQNNNLQGFSFVELEPQDFIEAQIESNQKDNNNE